MRAKSPDATDAPPRRPATSFRQSFNLFPVLSSVYTPPPPLPHAAPLKPFFSNPILIIQNVAPSKAFKDAQPFPNAPGPLFSVTKENTE